MTVSIFLCICSVQAEPGVKFQSDFPDTINRSWAGPEYWMNTLSDWQIDGGRLECLSTEAIRTVHILPCYISETEDTIQMNVRVGNLAGTGDASSFAGFLVGAGGDMDYRAAAIIHRTAGTDAGYLVGVTGEGQAVVRDMTETGYPVRAQASVYPGTLPPDTLLEVYIVPDGLNYTFNISVIDLSTAQSVSQVTLENVYPSRMKGNIALASHAGGSSDLFWFDDILIGGDKIAVDSDRNFGPIMAAFHTLSADVLNMTAQLFPLSANDTQTAALEIELEGSWITIATETAVLPGNTVKFRITDWDSTQDTPYRVRYDLKVAGGSTSPYYFQGTIRKDPVDKETITVAAFTGNHNMGTAFGDGIDLSSFLDYPNVMWFPHQDLVDKVIKHAPDLLFFSGDTIYEGASPITTKKTPESAAIIDYLYVWYLSCWSYNDIARDIPTVITPDDHDVFQGNLWGEGGIATTDQETGGYVMTPDFVNMVQRTQSGHLPDPFDPTPIEQGITVHYSNLDYGRISFAIIEDRKFKSGWENKVPSRGSLSDPFDADIPGLVLLGQRQLDFLESWASDWQNIDMKGVLSQTLFANITTHGGVNLTPTAGSYDSNGWPQTPRNNALKIIRKAYAMHISGDSHLAGLSQYAVEDWGDGPWAFSVPSVANIWPRAWNPGFLPECHIEGMPSYTGCFYDLMGNKITVWAVANPLGITGWEPAALHDRRPGYGIVKFEKSSQEITFECWPRYVDPDDPSTGTQYTGWPKTVSMDENYGRQALGYLPVVTSSYMSNPVVQVVKEDTGQVIYTRRILQNSIKPKVFEGGLYTVNIGEPGTAQWETFSNLQASICGDWGYSPSDLNFDCEVNIEDLSILAASWLNCTNPYQEGCL